MFYVLLYSKFYNKYYFLGAEKSIKVKMPFDSSYHLQDEEQTSYRRIFLI